ncbi:MAG: MBL fold metallo-hydrolase [Anaerolineae bacterium]|nr:MBL fold metallo-hydrolase [Anaerolineae bacterium]
MELTFLGGADEVGASSTLIRMGGKTILVDAGIRISPRTSRGIQNDQLPDLHPISLAGGPDYILVTHAHTDHTGALALVVEQYPNVPVLATRPTVDLTRILQADAQRIMQSKQEAEGELPIFDEIASERLMNAFQHVDYRQPVHLGEGLQVTYHPSGHIAGAATLVLEGEEGTLVMSGDVSMGANRAVISADMPRIKADALVLESTYGGKLHALRAAEERRMIETVKAVTDRGGKVLIPAFALGRAQEVLQIILAFRDELDVPVYADGMVRSVCNAYFGFQEWLPPNTVRAAGDDHLFFRDKVKAVANGAMRDQIVHSLEPAIVVASSGMLTGGASVTYAKAWAGDERNAIFLTGYQDEEAPGRFLQTMMRKRQAGEEFTLKIDDSAVGVRCEVGTYSLSAHADENELVQYASAFDVEEIMLVHGDPGARHSLATALRQRVRRVQTPRIGQTISFSFAKRPWALGRIKTGEESRPLVASELWEALKGQAGSFFSARELAQMWWGDADRAAEVTTALEDGVYFAPDWRKKDTFQVHSAEQVTRKQRQRAIMLANPDIVGKLIVLRDVHNRPRVGVVTGASQDAFEANVYSAKGRHYPADALLWVIGPWEKADEDKGMLANVGEMIKAARALQDTLLPYEQRQQLADADQPVDPATLLPETLPEDISPQQALLTVVLALAGDGATLEQGGLLPRRAMKEGPVEQNQARELAYAAFPPEARLRKVGMEVHRKRLTLSFDFPDRAADLYDEQIESLADQSGWDVQVNRSVNQQALGAAVDELLPAGGMIVKGPSFHMDRGEVHVDLSHVEDVKAFERAYLELTGFRLRASGDTNGSSSAATVEVQSARADQMEINAAYGLVRSALEPVGLYKVGLKQGTLVLTFISPQVGERYLDQVRALSDQTGYPISVHPHPNQQQILQVASQIAREAGWAVRKGPGIHVDRAEVSLKLAAVPEEQELTPLLQKFEEKTGYRLDLSAV